MLFFLGAGASVAADVPDTFNLVTKFLKDLEIRKRNSEIEKCRIILKTLEESGLGPDGKVDVELLLEALDQLENVNECIPLKFFSLGQSILNGEIESDASNLKKDLKDFIKRTGLVKKDDIQYLKDLLLFIEPAHKPLDIFSVNYDLCIEQFCDTFGKEYIDGFYQKWEPKSFERADIDVRLYKIHGSIIWFRTDKGSYVKLPIESEESEVKLTSGEKASALILYPMRKLEYTEPLLDLLLKLKQRLNTVKFVFVIGYSFRDNQIRQIFWNAAKKNKELIVILVSPSAYRVYEKRLRHYDTRIPSELDGRVVCLPYRFEKVLSLLKNLYLKELKHGLKVEGECKARENQGNPAQWESCLDSFINCEYLDKVDHLHRRGAWQDFATHPGSVPKQVAEAAFKIFLMSLVSNNDHYKSIWFAELTRLFSQLFNKTQLDLTVHLRSEPGPIIQPIIYPKFRLRDANHLTFQDCCEICDSFLSECNSMISLMKTEHTNNLVKVKKAIEKTVCAYFSQFRNGWITVSKFLESRRQKYPELSTKAEGESALLAGSPRASSSSLETLEDILSQIETQELTEILDETEILLYRALELKQVPP